MKEAIRITGTRPNPFSNMTDTQQQHRNSSERASLENPYPLDISYASSPVTPPPLSRTHSHASTDDVFMSSDSEPVPVPRRRLSRLNSFASSRSVHQASVVRVPDLADEMTAIATRGDPRNYASTVSTNQLTIREELSDKFSGWLGRFGAIELENKGSVARDHLALGKICDFTWCIEIVFIVED